MLFKTLRTQEYSKTQKYLESQTIAGDDDNAEVNDELMMKVEG